MGMQGLERSPRNFAGLMFMHILIFEHADGALVFIYHLCKPQMNYWIR